jgi:hypothetical protein
VPSADDPNRAWIESKIQRKVIEYAKLLGIRLIPVADRGRKGFPDLLGFMRTRVGTKGFLIEVKTCGGRVSAPQRNYHRDLSPYITVLVAYGYRECVKLIDAIYEENK